VDKLEELEAQMRTGIKSARAIIKKGEDRDLSPDEIQQLEGLSAQLTLMRQERIHLMEGKADAEEIRAKVESPGGNGWKAVAKAFGEGSNKVEVRLADVLGKTVTNSATTSEGIEVRTGVQAAQEDQRHFADALNRQNLGAGVLHVGHFELGARTVASGAIQRLPLDTSTKAELAQTLTYESLDVQQFAAKMGSIPAQLFQSVPQLETALQASIGVGLDKALDTYIYQTIDDHSEVLVVSGGSNFQTKLRRAMSDIRKQGGNPNVAFISDSDQETMDNLSAFDTNLPRNYPWNLNLVPSPLLQAGEFAVADSSGMILHLGSASYLKDEYSAMDSNQVRVRVEYDALLEINQPALVVVSGANLVT
jgi:hypothetical protein